EADGYKIPTRNFIAGRPINHGGWYPDYHLRLVRRSLSHYQEAAIHESIADPERIGYLETPLLHYTYDSIEHWRQKFDRYTTLEASHGSFSLLRLIFKPPFHFLRRYIWWSGYLDGRLGWIAAAMAAVTHF